jgi:hypothetical protein
MTTQLDERPRTTRDEATDPPVLHMVLKDEWPIALCGYRVKERFTDRSAGMDRCTKCLAIARQRGCGRPGWK